MKTNRIHLFMIGVALVSTGCALDLDEDRSTREPIINGSPGGNPEVSGMVQLSMGCSGTLLTNTWVLTAKHCLSNVTPGSVTVTMGTQTRTATAFQTHATLDAALVRVGAAFSMNGSTNNYVRARYLGTAPELSGATVQCYGYGRTTYNSGGGTLTAASLRVRSANSTQYALEPNAMGQIQWRGDSGGSCLSNGAVTGVQSTCTHNPTSGTVLECQQVAMWALSGWINGIVPLTGSMIVSDRGANLAINAWGGATNGTVLRLHNGCTRNNPDCTWTYRDGMLLSDRDPRLAINAWGGAVNGTVLRLSDTCTSSNPDCTWTLRNGLFYSDRNPALAINAWGGATNGTVLRLYSACPASNPDCTWEYRNVMLQSNGNRQFKVNAWGGAAHGTTLRLNNECTVDNPDCTFTLKRGMIRSDRNPALIVNAWGGAYYGNYLRLNNTCPVTNPDCTFTLRRGQILADGNPAFVVNAWGGAYYGNYLRLNNTCPVTNPDCTFTLASN